MSTPTNRPRFISPVMEVRGALIRPGELLVDRKREPELTELLTQEGGRLYRPGSSVQDWRQRPKTPPYGDLNAQMDRAGLGFHLWSGFPNEVPVRLVLEQHIEGLHFNHVFVGEDFYQGGPDGMPVATVPNPPISWTNNGATPTDLTVLDTGLPAGWPAWHPNLKASAITGSASVPLDPNDPLDEFLPPGLDQQAGHGLFICGLVARLATNVDIEYARVLHSSGEGDEAWITTALAYSKARVVNLSFGGYTPTDVAPVPLVTAVNAALGSGRVLVAAAGNAGDTQPPTRPFWPAALPGVIAVGACTYSGGVVGPWAKSNPGNVYAPGVDVISTYVHGGPFTGWARWSGTSFAAPLVAAKIAQSLIENPAFDPEQWIAKALPAVSGIGKVYVPGTVPV